VLNILMFAVILTAVLSWIHASRHNPAVSLLHSITSPMLKWSRKLLPPMSGLDLSPLIPIFGIQLLKMLILPPIDHFARLLS